MENTIDLAPSGRRIHRSLWALTAVLNQPFDVTTEHPREQWDPWLALGGTAASTCNT